MTAEIAEQRAARLARRRHHHVHQEPSSPAVSVHVGMDIDEDEMAEHDTNRRVRLRGQQFEKCRHHVAHDLVVKGDMARATNVDGVIAIAREASRL